MNINIRTNIDNVLIGAISLLKIKIVINNMKSKIIGTKEHTAIYNQLLNIALKIRLIEKNK